MPRAGGAMLVFSFIFFFWGGGGGLKDLFVRMICKLESFAV